ncbi:MAG TPA: hypothetical protein VF624_07325 [Tepidisphaeraceae bacterium]|jgi:hypothetical protein
MSDSEDNTLRELFRSLDQRQRPEEVAQLVLSTGVLTPAAAAHLKRVARHASGTSYMSQDFNRSYAALDRQVKLSGVLFAVTGPADPADLEAVHQYLTQIEPTIGKTVGRSDYKHDRLNKAQRDERGIDLSRRQYNKRFRLAARMEDKARRREREITRRALTLASKSRLASRLTWEEFSKDAATACFVAYYVARCNVRSLFTVNAQARPYDEACEAMMRRLRVSDTTNWLAVAHVMPDEEVVWKLSDADKGVLLGQYYEMLLKAGAFLREVSESSVIDVKTMIVRRGNDSTMWNLMAGAWNKLRDGWFNLCHALGADEIVERQCFGKVMRLIAADVAMWHRSVGHAAAHTDTDVWAELPLPWKVLAGEETCGRRAVEEACARFGIDPLKTGWIARRGEKGVETFRPTPELVHGVVVSSPVMARAMRKAGIFSAKVVKLDGTDMDVDALLAATEAVRTRHFVGETQKAIEEQGREDVKR